MNKNIMLAFAVALVAGGGLCAKTFATVHGRDLSLDEYIDERIISGAANREKCEDACLKTDSIMPYSGISERNACLKKCSNHFTISGNPSGENSKKKRSR
ncbi:MAG: hypothetical protein LBT92_00370 [Rickettsiales bacterium]|nr:hypothetical protein [Rickettsiales bacterium]